MSFDIYNIRTWNQSVISKVTYLHISYNFDNTQRQPCIHFTALHKFTIHKTNVPNIHKLYE